jgi:hypothetical protein
MAKTRLITRVGDRQLLRGEKIYVRDPARFVRNEDPPGKGHILGEVNEMMMNPEKFEKKRGLNEYEEPPIERKPSPAPLISPPPIISKLGKAVF